MVGGFTIGRRLPDAESITPDENGALTRSGNEQDQGYSREYQYRTVRIKLDLSGDKDSSNPSEDMTYVLSAQCKEGGAIKWIDGPYTCTGSNCLRLVFEIILFGAQKRAQFDNQF